MPSLRPLLAAGGPICAPLVLNPMMAKLAEKEGFEALYLGGGATGYAKVMLEANLNVSEMCTTGTEIASVTNLPLILDGATGYGDPMHMHRTIPMAETAGFAGNRDRRPAPAETRASPHRDRAHDRTRIDGRESAGVLRRTP